LSYFQRTDNRCTGTDNQLTDNKEKYTSKSQQEV